MAGRGGLVYSTGEGKMCPTCRAPMANCECHVSKRPPSGGVVTVSRDAKGRRGKEVTVITGVPEDLAGLTKLAKQLKKKCGSGGTVRDGTIEVQGDHRTIIATELEKRGWKIRVS